MITPRRIPLIASFMAGAVAWGAEQLPKGAALSLENANQPKDCREPGTEATRDLRTPEVKREEPGALPLHTRVLNRERKSLPSALELQQLSGYSVILTTPQAVTANNGTSRNSARPQSELSIAYPLSEYGALLIKSDGEAKYLDPQMLSRFSKKLDGCAERLQIAQKESSSHTEGELTGNSPADLLLTTALELRSVLASSPRVTLLISDENRWWQGLPIAETKELGTLVIAESAHRPPDGEVLKSFLDSSTSHGSASNVTVAADNRISGTYQIEIEGCRKSAPFAFISRQGAWSFETTTGTVSSRSPSLRLEDYALMNLVTSLANAPGGTSSMLDKMWSELFK